MNVIFGCSTVADGNMSLRWGTSEQEVNENKRKWLGRYGIELDSVVLASLALGTEIGKVGVNDKGRTIEDVDALITSEVAVPLLMVVGDCFPVMLVDQKKQLLALIHLGYHGIVGNLLDKVVQQFGQLGSRTKDMKMKIGPGVKKESYILPAEDVAQRGMGEWGEFLDTQSDGRIAVDLFGYLMGQAKKLGISHIDASDVDTIKDANYFSHYRAKRITGEQEGRIAAVAMMADLQNR